MDLLEDLVDVRRVGFGTLLRLGGGRGLLRGFGRHLRGSRRLTLKLVILAMSKLWLVFLLCLFSFFVMSLKKCVVSKPQREQQQLSLHEALQF